jgi:MFS family permease
MPQLRRLSTPRAAALAGVLFAILFGTALTLIRTSVPDDAHRGSAWLDGAVGHLKVASILMPFAGICFLWFIGVVRDGLGRYEDRFFASVFLGSGLLFLAMVFVSSAVGAALVASRDVPAGPGHDELVAFGSVLLTTLSKTYALRMGGVFMISLSTIWLKTGLMPRWLIIVTYLGAVTLLVAADTTMVLTLVFPAWVLLVSVLALVRAGVIDLHFHDEDPKPSPAHP